MDLYWGDFTTGTTEKLVVDLGNIRYETVDELAVEGRECCLDENFLNTVRCSNLSVQAFLANNVI